MVFPSIPLYLDPPTNWHQQQQPSHQQHHHHHQANGNESSSELLPQLPALQAQGPQMGSVRPGPMGDRGQIAKISSGGDQGTLKCPRCESSNTKFCYFNNYSLSQPRHFCKTCRRYWTRGGALRNVPVGGGCRRNKKTKRSSSHSKSPAAAAAANTEKQSSSSVPLSGFNNRGFMASLENMSLYGGGGVEQWRLHQNQHQQQFPNLLSGFDPITTTCSSSYSFPFVQSSNVIEGGLLGGVFGESRVKMEAGNGGLLSSLSSRISPLSFTENYSWTDLAASSSSAAPHLL
ncbi:hypothetical protein PIB30_024879 [Stylosanthes scabra]|uniref:Dof zinc finger protein n=1 Tax=Stylosanthes scabra TaxID=79078 RepID=A0ABU6RAD7_9FABA|nr:hypothetical protein [Stylosanthes scabra]